MTNTTSNPVTNIDHYAEIYNYYERISPESRKECFVGNGWYVTTRETLSNGCKRHNRRNYGLDQISALLAVARLQNA